MPEITVGNIRSFIKDGKVEMPPHAVYVGREVKRYGLPPSDLANPFPIGKPTPRVMQYSAHLEYVAGQITRAASILLYQAWLDDEMMETYSVAKKELQRLRALAANGDLLLLCWCHPKPCHADVIRAYLEAHDDA